MSPTPHNQMILRIKNALVSRLAPLLLGRHPRNTIGSFNYVNVRHVRTFLERQAAALPAHDLVFLDVGAGRSPYRQCFAGKIGRYLAVDVEESLPSNGGGGTGIEYHIGTAESIPLPEASVDVVLFNQVLEHVLDPDASLSEIGRVLKPGGILLGSVPHLSPVHLEPYDFRRYTDLGLRQMLLKHRFTEISIDFSGSVYSSAALLVCMDWMLSRRQPDKPQQFCTGRALLLSPLVATINVLALAGDALLPNSWRSAANLCWFAKKASGI